MENLRKHVLENVINGRSLNEYESVLGFSRDELKGHTVLNFGCGGSNLEKELREAGVECIIINADMLPNPHTIHDSDFRDEEVLSRREVMARKIKEFEDGQLILEPVEDHENLGFGIENRRFIQLNGSGKLPFEDDIFDDVFVSWVFHQLPEYEKENYLREFMRVGKRIYISPIGGDELRLLYDVLHGSNFSIASLLHYHADKQSRPIEKEQIERNRKDHLTDDGMRINTLDIDHGERPYRVGSYGCARIVLQRNLSGSKQ